MTHVHNACTVPSQAREELQAMAKKLSSEAEAEKRALQVQNV